MFWPKLKFYIVKNKLHQIALYVILGGFLTLFFTQFILPDGRFYQTEYASMWGTLFGAVIGGAFTLAGAYFASQSEIRGKFFIRLRNEILSPLYNELNEIHNVILPESPYPSFICYKKSTQTIRAHPQYSVWGQIKISTHYFETPKKLIKEMDKLYGIIANYERCLPVAASILDMKAKDILLSKGNFTCHLSGLGDFILPSIATENNEWLLKNFDRPFGFRGESAISEADKAEVCKEIMSKCNELPEIIQLKALYSQWMEQEGQTIELLRVLIESINYRYYR